MTSKANGNPDAGLRSLNHYQTILPKWRYLIRQAILPLIRYETPYLAWMQEKLRSPALDTYFAIAANLGTHTFFTIFLPIFYWCGHPPLGRGILHVLASGVFFSGFVKDLLCLPRPLSPPLQRITMSGSAALEYGFPSTHSTNAVSVTIFALAQLQSPDNTLSPLATTALQIFLYIYVFSIVLGRLYCGMHGFLDVIVGSVMGAVIAWLQLRFGPALATYVVTGTFKEAAVIALITLALVRIHPEPADDCPCYDDSVAFSGVFLGAQIGTWLAPLSAPAWTDHDAEVFIPYDFESLGWFKTIVRLVIGILAIFLWREIAKPLLLRALPPVFRVLGKAGLLLPRRFFRQAFEYKTVPGHLKDDNVLPSFSDIPNIITSIRHPRRRAVSVGPQSEADAYETLAYREQRRRDSTLDSSRSSGRRPLMPGRGVPQVEKYEHMMGTGSPEPPSPEQSRRKDAPSDEVAGAIEQDMFARIKKPRVRYDVEVVTKLIVYSGIALLVLDVMPFVYERIGLAP